MSESKAAQVIYPMFILITPCNVLLGHFLFPLKKMYQEAGTEFPPCLVEICVRFFRQLEWGKKPLKAKEKKAKAAFPFDVSPEIFA